MLNTELGKDNQQSFIPPIEPKSFDENICAYHYNTLNDMHSIV